MRVTLVINRFEATIGGCDGREEKLDRICE